MKVEIETCCGKLGFVRGLVINDTYVLYRLGKSEDKTEVCESGGKFPSWTKKCFVEGQDSNLQLKVFVTHPNGDICIGEARCELKDGEKWIDLIRDQVGSGQIKIKIVIKETQQSTKAANSSMLVEQVTRRPPEISNQTPGQPSGDSASETRGSDHVEMSRNIDKPQEETKIPIPYQYPIPQHMVYTMPQHFGPMPYPYVYGQNSTSEYPAQNYQPQALNRDMMCPGGHMSGPLMSAPAKMIPYQDPNIRAPICEVPSHNMYYGYQSYNPYYTQNPYPMSEQRYYPVPSYVPPQQGPYVYYQQPPNYQPK